jgi:hypothetical protein
LKLRVLCLTACAGIAALTAPANAEDRPQLFPAIAETATGTTVTGPVGRLVVYYDVLHYAHASLDATTTPIEPPELTKFFNTPPRALGFSPGAAKTAFDALDARASAWVLQARELTAHYQADIKALAAVATAYKLQADSADKKLALTAPGDAAVAIAALASGATGPAGQGAKLAHQIGYVVDGTAVKRDPAAPPTCDLDAPTADATNAPIFVDIPDTCVQGVIDLHDTLLTGVLRGTIETDPSLRITPAQADFLRTELGSINLTGLLPGGADNVAYASSLATVQTEVGLLVALTPDQFELTTGAGTCSRNLGGTKTTIAFTAVDRFQTGAAASVHRDVVTVMCYPRLASSAGVGYTTLPKTAYTTNQATVLTNAGGLPPAPAPTFQTIYVLSTSTQGSHVAGVSLLNLCLCAHPGDGTNVYASFGFIAPDGEPLGVFGGLTLGFARTYYVSFGEHYGLDTRLLGPNTVGNLVPQTFVPPTAQHWIVRPAAAFTIGL